MNRLQFVAAATGAPLVRPTPRPLVTADVTVQRASDALLDPFTVTVTLDDHVARIVRLVFPTADFFGVDVLGQGDAVVWSSLAGHKPIAVTRQLDVPPGLFRLASVTVDGTTTDRRAYAPGTYTVRVSMLGTGFGAVVDKPLVFAAPTAIADVLHGRPGTVVSVAGEQHAIATGFALQDASGSIRLSRSLGLKPTGTYVVRGFVDATGSEPVLTVGRFAPAFDNVPSPAP